VPILDEGLGVDELLKESLHLRGERSRDVLGKKDGVISPGMQGV